ncbi:uncharacterized protein LAESUDRAFT_721997 [Laetiporus sulphureus 93-53]|uniref:Transcription factor IIIC 90kDa subunit N-terminal domain-containing protein n=1 Tax=Laetiporus sulphureus 93-53 TaxID=1314785 RepID=A0A165G593_9APHY|nr:uncharacterized protein LAESUDRAFT_721997 [Laetiporus sulphureus 93-53]KZT09847.1 hypothetical protein LAESUDRAFT_721997 [Laetiporus sulphureus 93-53]
MAHAVVFSALSLPAVSASPSAKCIQWTGDGQLLLLTKSAVYILTPDIGIKAEKSVRTQDLADAEHAQRSLRSMSWSRTMVAFDKTLVHHWPADCQDWGAVSLGSLDPVLRAVSPSPSNLTADAGCLLAVLNSNMELALWGPVKNFLRGEWAKLLDITVELKVQISATDAPTLNQTLEAQTTCIEWSSQADFGFRPAQQLDGSLLAVGNKAGCVTLLRFGGKKGTWTVRRMATFTLSDRWITHVAWSTWKPSQNGACEASLACGTSDGSVFLVRVAQVLRASPTTSEPPPEFDMNVISDFQDVKVCESDHRSITALKWVNIANSHAVLVCSKPGLVHIWVSPSSDCTWSGLQTFPFVNQKLSVGASAICVVSGVTYIPKEDALVLCLTDGSFYVVHSVSTAPTSVPTPCPGFSSRALSLAARKIFVDVEPDEVSFKDVNRIFGMSSYDDLGTFVWLHEASQPTDFSYKHDARHISMFVAARLSEGSSDEELLTDIQARILSARTFSGEAPNARLRPVLLHLTDSERLSRLAERLVQVLQSSRRPPLDASSELQSFPGGLTEQMRSAFRDSLSKHIFGSDALLSERMIYYVAMFCEHHATDPIAREASSRVSEESCATIQIYVMRTLMRHISSVVDALTPEDVSFAQRAAFQMMQPGPSISLLEEAQQLLTRLKAVSPHDGEIDTAELCPACHAQVPLQDSSSAECANGHTWVRCSITSYILATPMVRTCVGCGRKAFLPLSQTTTGQNWVPAAVRDSWLAADVLDATRRCLTCGSNFVTLV